MANNKEGSVRRKASLILMRTINPQIINTVKLKLEIIAKFFELKPYKRPNAPAI